MFENLFKKKSVTPKERRILKIGRSSSGACIICMADLERELSVFSLSN